MLMKGGGRENRPPWGVTMKKNVWKKKSYIETGLDARKVIWSGSSCA